MKTPSYPLNINVITEKDKEYLLQQYLKLIELIKDLEGHRETANIFFASLSSLILSTMSFAKDQNFFKLSHSDPNVFLFMLFIVGFLIALSWFRVLQAYKKREQVYHLMLEKMESYLPANIFSYGVQYEKGFSADKRSFIASREFFIPSLFLIGYLLIGLFLFLGAF